jgi:hypothetical protein
MSFMRSTRIGRAVLAAAVGMATASCGVAHSGQANAQVGYMADRGSARAGATWPARLVLAEPVRLGIVSQVIDSRAKTDFALTSSGHGSFKLRRSSLAGGKVTTGPSFRVRSVALAGGSLWVFGARPAGPTAERMRLYRVSARTLRVERTMTLGPSRGASGLAALAPGTHGTIWVSFGRTVLHLAARTGATIGTIQLPSGLLAGDIALSPSGRVLYVATSHRTGGGFSPVLEYGTASLRKLAMNTKSVTAVNVGGGMLTAAPGGVWVSFRTGMLGQTVLLRQQDLRSVKLPGAGSRHSLFTWAMGATTAYAAPSLYLVQSVSAVAGCVSPSTGHIRARGHVAGHLEADDLLGSAHHGRVLYAAAAHGVFAIRPPAGCRAG